MKHTQILKQAWGILWSYRALWIFGIILALTTPNYVNSGNNVNWQLDQQELERPFRFTPPAELRDELRALGEFFSADTPAEFLQKMLPFFIAFLAIILLLSVIFTIGRYFSATALMRMVDHTEATGEKLTWRQGWRLGWSAAAWKLFLVDLVVYLPLSIIGIVAFGCAALPVLTGLLAGREPSIPGVVSSVGLFFLLIFLAIVVNTALSIFMEIIRRQAVLGSTGVFDSLRQGYRTVIGHFKDVLLMWLIVLGLNIAYFIVSIPVVLLLVALGGLAGALFGFGSYALFQAIASAMAGLISAIVIGLLLFLFILSIPLLFLGGLKETYLSTTWTLAYRAIQLNRYIAAALPGEEPGMELLT
jgi:hypothetical protein